MRTEVETVVFDLLLDIDPSDYDEQTEDLYISQLAEYYGVDPSLIAIEATVVYDDDDAHRARRKLSHGNGGASAGQLRLTVTITVPDEVSYSYEAPAEDAGDGLLDIDLGPHGLTAGDSTASGGVGSPRPPPPPRTPKSERFAGLLGASGTSSLSAVLGANVTQASEMVTATEAKVISVQRPRGYWCSAPTRFRARPAHTTTSPTRSMPARASCAPRCPSPLERPPAVLNACV